MRRFVVLAGATALLVGVLAAPVSAEAEVWIGNDAVWSFEDAWTHNPCTGEDAIFTITSNHRSMAVTDGNGEEHFISRVSDFIGGVSSDGWEVTDGYTRANQHSWDQVQPFDPGDFAAVGFMAKARFDDPGSDQWYTQRSKLQWQSHPNGDIILEMSFIKVSVCHNA